MSYNTRPILGSNVCDFLEEVQINVKKGQTS